MAKILVTGSKGQVGYCLVQQLIGKVELLALDRDELDITNKEAVFNKVKAFCPDVIINAAAYTAVDKAETEINLSEAINIKGPQYLAEAAAQIGAAILHISTDYVFNGQTSCEYQESDPVDPQSVYGRTKLEGELAVQKANSHAVILRTAWVFGEQGHNFVKTMIRLAKERDTLGIVCDQFGGPTYAGDIAGVLIKIAEMIIKGRNDIFGVYHFTGKPDISWFEFAKVILQQAELQNVIKKQPTVNSINTSDYPTAARRPANSRLDLTKIKQTFNIQASNWQKALENIKNYNI